MPFPFLAVNICSTRKSSCGFYDGRCQNVLCSWVSISGAMCYFWDFLPRTPSITRVTQFCFYVTRLCLGCVYATQPSTLELFWICLPFEPLLSSPSLWEVDKAVLISMNGCFSLYYSSDDSWLRTKHAHIVLFLPRLLSIAFAFWYHIPTSVKDVPINLSLLKWLLENTEGKIRKQTDWISYEGPMVWAPFCWYAGELTRLSSLTLMEKFITCHVNFQTLQRHLLLLICYITWLFLNAQISKKELFYQSWNSKITSH